MPITFREATMADMPAIESLLRENALPLEGLSSIATAVVACDGPRVIGSAALEIYEDGALLRSVAVQSEARGTGIGQRLTREVLAVAKARGVADVYLLTTTAGGFFPRLGFVRVPREDVPASVQQSIEFRGACPATALAMRARSG
jgi:amino-acid N-acetyltransferase